MSRTHSEERPFFKFRFHLSNRRADLRADYFRTNIVRPDLYDARPLTVSGR